MVTIMTSPGTLLARQLEQVVPGPMWHGAALDEMLHDVTAEEACAHPIAGAHSIAELVAHLTGWCRMAVRRLDGFTGEAAASDDWPSVDATTELRWREATAALAAAHAEVAERTRALSDAAVMSVMPGRTHTAGDMLVGLVAHAAYHGGQIALLKKVLRSAR